MDLGRLRRKLLVCGAASPALRGVAAAVVVLGAIAIGGSTAAEGRQSHVAAVDRGLSSDSGQALHHDKSPPLRSIGPKHTPGEAHPAKPTPPGPSGHSQTSSPGRAGSTSTKLAPIAGSNFDGLTDSAPNTCACAPPDNEVAAGATQIVELVNSELAVYSKTGGTQIKAESTNTLWSGFGGLCQSDNDGDGTVTYDTLAQRWVIQQFAVTGVNRRNPYQECIAISTSSDATGSYYRYSFGYSSFPDYPKLGVWSDGYYASFNRFQGNTFLGAEMCAFDRSKMLTGAAATQQCLTPSAAQGSVLPATIDGPTAPPSGESEWFVGISPTAANSLAYWKFHVDWANTSNTSLTGPTGLTVNAFSEACGGDATCIPQPGTSQQLDSLGDRLMWRLAYRNFGDHEAMVVSHSVTSGSSVGARWYELRPSNGALTVNQQGTYAPDGTARWMGSIAMDQAGDAALAYSTSSSALHPGIAYTGRVPSDPAGTMSQGETTLYTGAGSQTGGLSRWGDYSELSVDPADDCTFWYANEYLPSNGSFNWNTRVGSFKLAGCGSSQPTLSVSPSSVAAGGTVTVTWSGVANPTSADWIGIYHPGDPSDGSRVGWFYGDSCTQSHGSTALGSGSCTIPAPSGGGAYELRLFSNNSYTVLATSNQLTVTGGATLSVSPASVAPGGTVTVTWSGVPNPTSTDWIGVYHPGDPSTGARVGWFFDDSCTQPNGTGALASGSCTFTMPATAGTYEFRLFANNTYDLIATSNQVTVG